MNWTFELPIPTSTNHIWKAVGSRFVLSPQYRRWIAEANTHLLVQTRPRFPISGNIDAELRIPDKKTRDVDNCSKAVLDLLQSAEVIDNDRDINRLLIYRSADQRPGTCQILLKSGQI